jgi:predicted lipoprotein with Yx(FWY)xxD motif
MLQSRAFRSALGAAVVAVLVAGCASSGGASIAPTNPPSSQAPASQPPASAPASEAPGGEVHMVELHQDATLGAFLTGEDGKSLYLFGNDSAGTSTCSGGCAEAWPPFVLDEGETVEAADGVTGTLATITRDDGSEQVTIDDLPLYYFAGDDGPAQTNGQGVNDVWYLAAPDGSMVGADAGPGSSGSKPRY